MIAPAILLAGMVTGAGQTPDLPPVGDPIRLLDLRWLARPIDGQPFLVDTFSSPGKAPKRGNTFVLADVQGPGVLEHLMVGPRGLLYIEVDGRTAWQGKPQKRWPRVYPSPKPSQRGTAPFAFPLVQTAWSVSHLALPIPFSKRLVVRSESAERALWLAGRRLKHAARIALTDPAYVQRAGKVCQHWNGRVEESYPIPGSHVVQIEAFCAASQRTRLVDLAGSGEVVGLVLDVIPGAYDLLRHLVIEITPDGLPQPVLAMPLVDWLGITHPWPHSWFPRAGDRVAGLLHPYCRNKLGRWLGHFVIYFKLPMPFARGLRIDVRNRSRDLPMTLRGHVRVAPLGADEASRLPRLCGTSRRVDLPRPEGTVDLLHPPGPGHLVGLSVFATGNRTLYHNGHRWRRADRVELLTRDGTRVAGGPGLMPLAHGGNSPMGYAVTWNQNSVYPRQLIGAGRHFWLDPLPLHRGSRIRYTSGGPNGPTRAEVGALWYQMPPGPGQPVAYTAPAQPDDVEPVPALDFGLKRLRTPGGWAAEAEDLAGVAVATGGTVHASTTGGMDAFASRGAYLAWHAPGPGHALDLLVPMPTTPYVGVLFSKVMFPSGGAFNIELVPAEQVEVRPLWGKGDADVRSRVLGRAEGVCRIDCHNAWPWARKAVYPRRPIRNPSPGRVARIRFTCVTKRGRAYLLALDQLGMEPCPPTPDGWHEIEAAPVVGCDLDLSAGPMPYGRRDLYGWGARAVEARGIGHATMRLVRVLAAPAAGAVELRGVLESGTWALQLGTAKSIRLEAKAQAKRNKSAPPGPPKKPVVWTLPLAQPMGAPIDLALRLTCHSTTGRLLLDAWRLKPVSE